MSSRSAWLHSGFQAGLGYSMNSYPRRSNSLFLWLSIVRSYKSCFDNFNFCILFSVPKCRLMQTMVHMWRQEDDCSLWPSYRIWSQLTSSGLCTGCLHLPSHLYSHHLFFLFEQSNILNYLALFFCSLKRMEPLRDTFHRKDSEAVCRVIYIKVKSELSVVFGWQAVTYLNIRLSELVHWAAPRAKQSPALLRPAEGDKPYPSSGSTFTAQLLGHPGG